MPPFLVPLTWLLVLYAAGWLALPLVCRAAERAGLPDAGLAAGRVLLPALAGLLVLWCGTAGLPLRWCPLPLGLLAALGLAGWARQRREMQAVLTRNRRGLLETEVLTLLVFLTFLLLRGWWPDTGNGEKPMDMALIGSCWRAEHLPPPNPYAAGFRLESYYYFGHLLTATLTRVCGSEPRWTYNAMCATLPALLFALLASLGAAVAGNKRLLLWFPLLLLGAGTLQPWRQWLATEAHATPRAWPLENLFRTLLHLPPREGLEFFATSRVIPYMSGGLPHYTINEYPWFTFNYADLHAHYFAMLWCVLLLAFSWVLSCGAAPAPAHRPRWIVGIAALVLGALIMTNTWDAPVYALLLLLCLWAQPWPRSRVAIAGGALLVVAAFVALPFLRHLHSAAHPPALLAQPASPLRSWLLMWGPWLGAWWLFLLSMLPVRTGQPPWRQPRFVVPGILAAGLLLVPAWGVLLCLVSTLAATLWCGITVRDVHTRWLCRLAGCGLVALLWSETTWAGFLDPPYHRQDTVFKFGLQAWYLLGSAGILAAFLPRAGRPALIRWPWGVRLLWLPVLATMYTSSAVTTLARARGFEQFEGLDAWAHLPPPERQAAAWLQAHTVGEGVLVEAEDVEGGDYTAHTRYTHATGIPTIIGPQAHTFQWGLPWEEVFRRKAQVRLFYRGDDWSLLQQFTPTWIVAGELERLQYGRRVTERLLHQNRLTAACITGAPSDPHRVVILQPVPEPRRRPATPTPSH